ncbi:uncharacterized protein DS421_15g511660 [Arachis hypogaea]|nr:uncharacterized protein DS421_15g511660 [Arachis hypogaea]
MMKGSRDRSNRSCGRGRGSVSTESSGTVQSLPYIPTTSSTLVASQAGPADQQFIIVPNSNYVPLFATSPTDPMTDSTVGDSSSAPSRMPLHYRLSSG